MVPTSQIKHTKKKSKSIKKRQYGIYLNYDFFIHNGIRVLPSNVNISKFEALTNSLT